jgi:hypothetical protein
MLIIATTIPYGFFERFSISKVTIWLLPRVFISDKEVLSFILKEISDPSED